MSELMVQISIVLLVLLAMGFGAVALGIRLVLGRSPRITGALAAMCVLLALSAPGLKAKQYSAKEAARIELQRQRLAPAIEQYRRTHGGYPPTAEAAGVKLPRTPYGTLYYHTSRSDQGVEAYHVTYGEDEIHGFTATWSSDEDKWHISRNCGALRDVDCEDL
jgi:type II secretory pathway pseudopilin PulG